MEDNRYLVDYSNVNRFAILQLSEADTIERGKRYSHFSDNEKYTADDYEISYFEVGEPNRRIDLDSLYARFNGVQPNNYYGHNLSVSDVIIENYNGETSAYYVDSIGFKKLDNDFLTEKITKRFDFGLDVRKELRGINANADELKANLEVGFNAEDREKYLLSNYSGIFALAEMRNRTLMSKDLAKNIDEFLYKYSPKLYINSFGEKDPIEIYQNDFNTIKNENIARYQQDILNGNIQKIIDEVNSNVGADDIDDKNIKEYGDITERLRELDLRHNPAIAELVSDYEDIHENDNLTNITEWFGDYALYEFKLDVPYSEIQERVNKALSEKGLSFQEFMQMNKTNDVNEIDENIKNILSENQEKLKAIYEEEKGLPFQSVKEDNGFYLLHDIENIETSELANKIDKLYERVFTSIFTTHEPIINENSKNIEVINDNGASYEDTFYVIDKADFNGQRLYLLESEEYGEDVPCVIVDEYNNVILEDVENGFDDYIERREDLIKMYALENPISFKDDNGNYINITNHYTLPHDLQFVDQENHKYEYLLGTINVSDMKLILKTENDDLLYSSKLDEAYENGSLNLSDTLNVDDYTFSVLGNTEKINNNPEMTVHFRYDEEKNINGWGGYVDTVTFDDFVTAMKYVNKEEAVYDYLDNYYEIKKDETPLYVTNADGMIVWENDDYVTEFVSDIRTGKLSSEDIAKNLYIMQGMNGVKDFEITVYDEKLTANYIKRFPYENGNVSYQIGNVEFKSEDIEQIYYKNEIIGRDLLYKGIGTVEAELLQEGEFGFTNEQLKKVIGGIKNVKGAGTYIYLNELNGKFSDNNAIQLGVDILEYDNDKECYALYKDTDPEMQVDYFTYFDIEDIKEIYVGNEQIKSYYTSQEQADIRKNRGITDVAIESTDDYTDNNFHKELVDIDVQNEDGTFGKTKDFYRVVCIGSDGVLKPLNNEIYSDINEARKNIDSEKFFEIGYDDIVYRSAHEMQKYKADMEKRNQLLDKYEDKGFEFPLREEYSDKYIINLCNAIEQAETQGYSDKAIIEIAKAKARYIDVDKAISSIPLVKNADLVANIKGIEFYARKDNPTLIITYNENYHIDGDEDVLKACERIYDNYYSDLFVLAEIGQEEAYRQRVYTDDEIIGAIKKEAGLFKFSEIKKEDYVLVDTETTGFANDDEVVEIGILSSDGTTLYSNMFKPFKEMGEEAGKINGITNEKLQDKSDFADELSKINEVIGDKKIVIFNKAFDSRMIIQTAQLHNADSSVINDLQKKLNNSYCAMQSYADYKNLNKVVSLNNALKENGIDVIQSHSAVDDCKDTLALMNVVADKQIREEYEITPIKEFVKNGKILKGSEVPSYNIAVDENGFGFGLADRSLVYNAVLEFMENNSDYPNLPKAISSDGSYEDKEFLYTNYDEYVALSHKKELEPYVEKFNDYVSYIKEDSREHGYTVDIDENIVLEPLSKIYYAKHNGLSDKIIDFFLNNVNMKSYSVSEDLDNCFNSAIYNQNALNNEQIIKIYNEFNREADLIFEMIADGGTLEQAETLKGLDYNVILPMRYAYTQKSNPLTVEQGREIVDFLKEVANKNIYNYFQMEYVVNTLTDEVRNNNVSAEEIKNTFSKFLNQNDIADIFDYVKMNGWSDHNIVREVTHDMTEETLMENEEIKTEKQADKQEQEKNVTLGEETEQEDKSAKAELMEKLKEGVKKTLDSENFANWCRQQGRLYYNNYSLNNAFLTYMQNPKASYVCGYEQWKEYGRQVQKGAKGIKIFSPMFVQEKYGKGSLFALIKKNCDEQIKNGKEYGTFSLQGTKLSFNMQKNGLFDVKVGDKTYLAHATAEEFKKFLDRSVIGKVPRGYNVVTVFDINDTTKDAEFLWVKKENCKKEELVLDKNGEPIRNNRGQYKIYNTDERRSSFNVPLDITIKDNDNEKLEILYATLRELSEKKGVPITECDPTRDTTLSGGARGYFKMPSEEFPKGNIVISSELPLANKVSTTFHEIAHSDLHADLEKLKTDMELGEDVVISRQMKEIQAEGVAFMTASNFGLETDHKSFNYIANWSDGRELKALEDSMNIIYKESTKLMKDIEKVLDEKGLSLNLEAKDLTPLNESEKQAFLEPFSDYALNGLRKIGAIQKQAFTELKQTDNEQVQTIIKEQIYLTRQAELKLNEMYSRVEKFRDTDDKRTQINLQMQLKALKTQVDDINVSIDDLSQERMDLVIENYKNSEKADLRSLFAVDSKEVFKDLAKTHSELNELSDIDLKFLANSDFIKTEYSKLLDVDNDKFVELSLKHLDDFKSVMSKNKTAVEINWCENWTDKPIFKKDKGYLLHPALANKIIANAEKQIEGLKKVAEKNNEYFPYSKCKLTIHSMTEIKGKDNLSSLVTTVDIGDGEQKDLREHVEQILSKSRSKEKMQILDNFNKSVKERSNINSVEAVHYSDLQTASVETERNNTELNNTQDDISLSMSDWKNEVLASDNVTKTNEVKENKTHVVSNDTKEKE